MIPGFNLSISGDGKRAAAVYSDSLNKVRQVLGKPDIKRASNVEWDAERELWVARLQGTGEIIAEGEDRDEVIRQEVEILNKSLIPKMVAQSSS